MITMCYIYEYLSPIGTLYMISDGSYLTHLQFNTIDNPSFYVKELDPDLTVFKETKTWLDSYFSGNIPGFTPPLSLNGTAFQLEVWNILLGIPYGQTISYGDIAKQLATRRKVPRMSAQAVGNAVGKNPIPIIVPCHRVIGSDGSLTGYAGGLERKSFLLSLEKTATQNRAGI